MGSHLTRYLEGGKSRFHLSVTIALGILLTASLSITGEDLAADTEEDYSGVHPLADKSSQDKVGETESFWLGIGVDMLHGEPAEAGLEPGATTEALGLIGATAWHNAGYTGSGVKVGILSTGFGGYESLLGSELPDSVTTHWATSVGGPGASLSGTLLAQIVHDVAPGANLYLANFPSSSPLSDWGSAIDWFITQGVDIVVASGGFIGSGASPLDGSTAYCAKVSEARSAGILFCQPAGDLALKHWGGPFVDTDEDDCLEFVAGVDEGNNIYATAGSVIYLSLWWDDPWGASSNDYDLALFDEEWVELDFSARPQDGDDDPWEQIAFEAPWTGWYKVAVFSYDSDHSAYFDLFSYHHELERCVSAGSLVTPGDSAAALTVGAVPWDSPTSLEPYSSCGPTGDYRMKPNLVAPDGTATTVGAWHTTNAAAAHVAGAAALVQQCFSSYDADETLAYLESNAVDLGDSGKDNLFGSGRVCLPEPPPLEEKERTTWGIPVDFRFDSTLQLGTSKPDVKYLQILLNMDPDTRVATAGPGSPGYETACFRELTLDAVIRFQEKYAEDILVPVGLTTGTGVVGPNTRNKLNSLLNYYFVSEPTEHLLTLGERRQTVQSAVEEHIGDYPELTDFPVGIVLAMAAQETGDYYDWNNELVSHDWGRGILQVTTSGYVGAGTGNLSEVCTQCRENDRCGYTMPPSGPTTPCLKYYENSTVGIENNIRDALYALADKHVVAVGTTTVDDSYLTADEADVIEAVWFYNGQSPEGLNYVRCVRDNLVQIGTLFPGFTMADKDAWIARLDWFLQYKRQYFTPGSPGELAIFDAEGNATGIVDGVVVEDIPFSQYDPATHSIVIGRTGEVYNASFRGTAGGVFSLRVMKSEGSEISSVELSELPTLLGAIHQFEVDWDALASSTPGIAGRIDSDGDGTPEESFQTSPPYAPSNASPSDGEDDTAQSLMLSWDGGDPDPGDVTQYNVYLGTREPLTLVSEGQSSTLYEPTGLYPGITYVWQVLARDNNGATTSSSIWSFTVEREDADLTLNLKRGWNMVSVPLDLDAPSPDIVFPQAEAIYEWNAVTHCYSVPISIRPQRAYWVSVPADTAVLVTGNPVYEWTRGNVLSGWNMIGSTCDEVSAIAGLADSPSGSILTECMYTWDPVGGCFIPASEIEPGKGYWIAASEPCTLTMSPP